MAHRTHFLGRGIRVALAGVFGLCFVAVLPAVGQTCDPTVQKHVYNPQRLKVLKPCVSVTGIIVDATHGKRKDGVRHEGDGDPHGWLKLDPSQEQFLNAGNMSNEGGNLVYEVVCLYRVTQKDAVSACKGYKSPIKLAPVGSHVRITGTWVQDTNHAKWNEIHPVSAIDILSK